MNPTNVEKLIIAMLCEIYEHQKIEGEFDPKLIKAAIWGDKGWGIEWEYPFLFPNRTKKPDNVSEVVDILDMWTIIESYYGRLSPEEKESVKKEAHPYGSEVKLPGFDFNDERESEYGGIAQFLVDDLHKWSNFKGRDFNSHCLMLDRYRMMLTAFLPMRPQVPDTPLSAAQIVSILKAQQHA
jgi:uncharacterized protein YfbU (UPF0304 family)